ncbi:MAG TPA: circadian clock protein KaiA [Chroococcidiopsis sp.]
MHPHLSICAFLSSDALAQSLRRALKSERFTLTTFNQAPEFIDWVERSKQQIDCLILEASETLPALFATLRQSSIFLPTVVLTAVATTDERLTPGADYPEQGYHPAVLALSETQIKQLEPLIERSIGKFLQLSAESWPVSPKAIADTEAIVEDSILKQQRRLADKLRERLGYLGVYYKRNPTGFFRHMTPVQKKELLQQLKADYREIILTYFSNEPHLNEQIDNFVYTAFFADISVPQILELHMELMDEFSKQLKLEGRSDEILLDYRLALIDTIAHLCELYRRSIPRES